MMNTNDTYVNLSIGLGSTDHSLGAGVNANLRFAKSDPISELVWSPHKGLTLKFADSSLADKKPFRMWNMGSSSKIIALSQTIISKGTRVEKEADHGKLTVIDIAGDRDNNRREDEKGVRIPDLEVDFCSAKKNVPFANSAESKNSDDEVTSACGYAYKNKAKMFRPKSIEASGKTRHPSDNPLPVEKNREKGKEKVLSNGDMYKHSSNGDNDSNESVESCNNSVGSFSRGVKRANYGQQMVVVSKRMRNQIQEIGDSRSIVKIKPNSSFVNWMSNMVKGLSDMQNDSAYNNKSNDFPRLNTSFQTVFQSMYCRNTRMQDIQESEELTKSCYERNDSSCKKIVESNEVENLQISRKIAGKNIAIPLDSSCEENKSLDFPLPGKNNHLSSLWITRLSSRNPRFENCKPVSQKMPELILENQVNENDASFIDKKSSISPEIGNSEAMASVFAERLDALKHNITSRTGKSSPCYFCGRVGHDLPLCPEVTESELRGLLVNLSSYEGTDESPCMCIRCFRFDHWAISCPSANNSLPSKVISNPGEIQKSIRDDFRGTERNNDAPVEIFDVVRKLRLSRVDILGWMNSNVSMTNLNGFFLRLRLTNLEEKHLGTGYYVACITGDNRRENIDRVSKKCILVDVGGVKSSVGSQYVSNHDFLEDEIKDWWCRIQKTGSKIPSMHELNSKFEDKKNLGF